MTTEEKIIKNKLGLIKLARTLGNVSQACKVIGYSRDSFYRFKELYEQGGDSYQERQKFRLEGEIGALNERQAKLSSRIEKASIDFERDIKLIRETRNELAQISEMKGGYERELENMEWVSEILPFLHYPDKVDDLDFKLATAEVGCIDKWLPSQNLSLSWGIKWGDIKKCVQTKECSLSDLLDVIYQLRERIKAILPSYIVP